MSFDGQAFGHRVKSARTWAGLGVGELAHRLRMSDEAIYEIERGERKRKPSGPILRAIAEALGQSEEWLLDGDTPPWSSPATPVQADVLERARQVAVRLADDLEELAGLLEADDEAVTG